MSESPTILNTSASILSGTNVFPRMVTGFVPQIRAELNKVELGDFRYQNTDDSLLQKACGCILPRSLPTLVLSSPFKTLSQTPDHKMNHCDINHRLAGFCQVFVVFAQSSIASKPRKCPLYNPKPRTHHKPFCAFWSPLNL